MQNTGCDSGYGHRRRVEHGTNPRNWRDAVNAFAEVNFLMWVISIKYMAQIESAVGTWEKRQNFQKR